MEMQGAVIVRSSPIVQAEYAARIYKHHPEFADDRRLSAEPEGTAAGRKHS